MDVGDQVTRLIGGIVPEQQTITRISVIEGMVYCGELAFDIGSGMEVNNEREWGPKFEKTNSYLKEILDMHKAMRMHKRAVVAAAEALNAANEDEA